jgi:ferredoxin/flavodoxin
MNNGYRLQPGQTVRLAYFSGTGGTRRAAICLKEKLQGKGVTVELLNVTADIPNGSQADLVIVLFAVYACNAPRPVYEFIKRLPVSQNTPAAVLSVSGGGEVSPNTACRSRCIHLLQKKGYQVVYEEMLVMPSNWIIPIPDGMGARLLSIMPQRAERIALRLMAGKLRRTKPHIYDRFFSLLGRLEGEGAKSFGKRIGVSAGCSGCGLCAARCPAKNIAIINGKPVFANKCLLCLNCIYGCPANALQPGMAKFVVIKGGYDLKRFESCEPEYDRAKLEQAAKGYVWKGVRKYIFDEENV